MFRWVDFAFHNLNIFDESCSVVITNGMSCLVIVAVRPAAASSIFLSNKGEGVGEPFSFLIVVVVVAVA